MGEFLVLAQGFQQARRRRGRQIDIGRWCKLRRDAVDHVLRQFQRAILDQRPLGFGFLADFVNAGFMHQDLDPRLVEIVAAAMAVIDAQDGFQIAQQMLLSAGSCGWSCR